MTNVTMCMCLCCIWEGIVKCNISSYNRCPTKTRQYEVFVKEYWFCVICSEVVEPWSVCNRFLLCENDTAAAGVFSQPLNFCCLCCCGNGLTST